MEEYTAVLPPKEVAEEILGMSVASLDVDSLEDGNDILQHELGVVLSSAPSFL